MDILWVREQLKAAHKAYEDAKNTKVGKEKGMYDTELNKQRALSHFSGNICAYENILTKMKNEGK